MTLRKLVSVGVALVAMSLTAEAKVSAGWELEAISKSTGYSVKGEEGSTNQFGLLKHSNTCAADELYISWISDSANIWPLAGKQISLAADFGGVALDIPVEVVAIRPMSGDRYQVVFGRSFANAELLSLMANTASVNLVMASPEVAQFFSVTDDQFPLQGFAKARLDAQSRCQSQSS
jgi:hypothetical protein